MGHNEIVKNKRRDNQDSYGQSFFYHSLSILLKSNLAHKLTPGWMLDRLVPMGAARLRKKKIILNYQKKRQRKDFAILWVLGVTFLASVLVASWGGGALYQKVVSIFSPVANELEDSKTVQAIESADGKFDPENAFPIYDNLVLDYQPKDIAQETSSNQVLAANTTPDGREKWIEIDLSEQRMRAKEGESTLYDFVVSTGKKSTPTPTGEFRPWIKMRYALMTGGSKAKGTYYYLPNVPYVMYFYQGYGIHGAYWHKKFGTPISNGCINTKPEEMAKIYEWAGPVMPQGHSVVKPTAENPGIRIVIHE